MRGAGAWLARLALLLLGLVACAAAGFLLYGQWRGGGITIASASRGPDPDLGPAQRLYLESYLRSQAERLNQPLAPGRGPVSFIIEPGESAAQVADALAAAGLISDRELFVNYLRYYGLDSELEAGSFRIDPQISMAQLGLELTDASVREITLRFLEGWRAEEMAAYLTATTPAAIDAGRFLALVRRELPLDLSPYPAVRDLPPDAALEGFLFPDTYTVAVDADAETLLALMLANFEQRVTPTMREAYASRGLTLREAVTLASIVEREAPLVQERPLVAGVFYNRLAQGMPLQADPTVQYAVGYDPVREVWWKSPLSQADLQVQSPYNTYRVSGLPPGPIANPGLNSLEAVAQPEATPYLFFVADCEREGAHLFSTTYEEHLDYVERCR
ncbi:MAG: endolytic transglycosylase MltG [Candidatus Promineifilaceae bacterium]|nr:endolytic transglycosylase MltG [Candidatus Promineifilaceae bacterium]